MQLGAPSVLMPITKYACPIESKHKMSCYSVKGLYLMVKFNNKKIQGEFCVSYWHSSSDDCVTNIILSGRFWLVFIFFTPN